MPFAGYPADCPPADSTPCAARVYRLVARHSVAVTDFVSYFARNPGGPWEDPCVARGLSVCLEYEAAARLRKRIKALGDHKIAVAQLDSTAGLIKQTGKVDHHTWWPDDGFEPLNAFAIDEQETQ